MALSHKTTADPAVEESFARPERRNPEPCSPCYSAYIAGTGFDVPERVVTNADLQKLVDTSDEWIVARTGMKERRVVSDGQAAYSDLTVLPDKTACVLWERGVERGYQFITFTAFGVGFVEGGQ